MTSSPSKRTERWISRGSPSIQPPEDYWEYLGGVLPGPQSDALRVQFGERLNEFTTEDLPPPDRSARGLLDLVSEDGWLRRESRYHCPNCELNLNDHQASEATCPGCGEAFSQHGGVTDGTVYVRTLAPGRSVDWVVAIHGMNTRGPWQEEFSWHLGTTWGRSVPVAVYKYGLIIAGVILAWRRRKLRVELRRKLVGLQKQARARGYSGNPDVIAHSFGTWLLGHLLKAELAREPEERLRFGRIILTGCVLRPDFNWTEVKKAGLVEDVLNHYGSKDPIVPMAHATIWDSGPSGRRGFDGDEVINIRAEGYGHSDLFSIEKCIIEGRPLLRCFGQAGELSQLEYSYKRYWRPFLTLPKRELRQLPDRLDPEGKWSPLPWPLRGTVFPFLALPLMTVLSVWVLSGVAIGLATISGAFERIALAFGIGLLGLLASTGTVLAWRGVVRWALGRFL